jgi:CRP-like cAMP-binding protein
MAAGSRGYSNGIPGGGPSFVAPPMWNPADDPGQPLTDEERAFLAVNSTVVRFRKGENIFNAGDPAAAVFSIVSGVVKLYRLQPGQREHIVRFMFPNELIGLAEYGQYVNSAKSITATLLYNMPTQVLEPRLRQSPSLEFHVINRLCHDLRRTQDHALLLAKRHASAKIGLFIQILEAQQNVTDATDAELYLPMTRVDIGSYLGVSPEAVTRGFGDLVSCGAVLFTDRRHLKIADRAKLEAVIADTERSDNRVTGRARKR